MRNIIICILGIITFFSVMVNIIFVASAWSATTENLLSNDFSDTTKWSGNNQSIRHGDNIIAFIDGGSVNSTVSLDDHLLQSEINNGFTANLDAEIWYWNQVPNQTVTSTLTIVGTDGTTYEQNIVSSGICNRWNGCGYEDLGTNSITVGANSQSNFDLTSTFSATAPNTTGHYAADLRLPSLTVEYNEFIFDLDLDLESVEDLDLDIDVDTFEIDDFMFTTVEPFVFEELEFDVPMQSYEVEIFAYEDDFAEIETDFEEVDIELDVYEEELPEVVFYEEVVIYDEPASEELEEFELAEATEDVDTEVGPEIEEVDDIEADVEQDTEQDVEVEVEQEVDEVVVVEHEQKEINVNTYFQDIIVMQTAKIESIINTQPLLFDNQEFYSAETIYDNQFVYVDNRLIYNTVYEVKDPVIEHEKKVLFNKQKQQQLMSELKLLKWKN